MMQSGFFYKDLEQVGVLLLVQKSVGYCRRFHAVPLTSKIHKKTYLPTHIFISSFKAVGLRTNSIAQCEQLCDVKDTDLIEKIGKVSKNQLRQITKGMQIQLGMSTKHNNPIA